MPPRFNPYYIGASLAAGVNSLAGGIESAQQPGIGQALTGLKAAGEGFAAAGPAGLVATPLLAGIGQGIATNQYIKGIDPTVDLGQPGAFQGGQALRAMGDIKDLEHLRSNASGFQRIFGARGKAEKKANELRGAYQAAQQRYNAANISQNETFLAQQAYMDKVRGNNPYGLPLNYY